MGVFAMVAAALFTASVAVAEQSGKRGNAVVALDSRIAGDDKRTRFVVDLDKYVDFEVFALADPYRVVVDLPAVTFQLSEGAGKQGRGLVSAYRYGLFAAGKSRIVLDTTGPVEIDKAYTLEAQDDQPARLVVDLIGTDRESALAAIAANPSRNTASASEQAVEGHAAVPPGSSAEDDDIVIVIDPGHGGIDPGAVSKGGTKEKTVVLEFAQRLKASLEDVTGFEVHLTRDGDQFLSLTERVEFARTKRASLFISIHADSVSAGSVSGASVYTLSDRASDAVAAALAEQENRSDLLAGVDLVEDNDDVTDILIDLVRRETRKYATFFARTLVENLRGEMPMVKNPLRSAGFRVLRAHDVPSILLELGYLTNTADEKLLVDKKWQDRAAERVATAVSAYFGDTQARAPF